jgi:GNAT superfamily N-acetyltransferase
MAEEGGRVVGAAVRCGKWLRILAVEREWRGRGLGTALLEDAKAAVIGAEPGNYFTPGVLDGGFFEKRGYRETARTWNLLWSAAALPPLSSQSGGKPPHAKTLDFIEREFGKIWRFEAAKAFERDIPTIAVERVNGELAGFAAWDVNNRGLGFFGPTGVRKDLRGRGIGCRLLHVALHDLTARLGYQNVVIPWTDALDFYAKCCGAKPANQFMTFAIDSAP